MNSEFQKTEVQDWIWEHTKSEVAQLALKPNPFPQIPYPQLLHQVSSRAKAEPKLPEWFGTKSIIYPSKISLEQTSSSATARFKASLIEGKTLLDATGGFGVDDYFFAQRFETVHHCELDSDLSRIVAHNLNRLGVNNVCTHSGDSTEILKSIANLDWIYVDPSRRNESKGKVFLLRDCLPNVPDLLDFYFSKAPQILMKTAPMLDITQGLSELRGVHSVYVVALKGEVKELLWILHRDYRGVAKILTVNLESDFDSVLEWNQNEASVLSGVKRYLYEPDAALRKAGVFEEIGSRFQIGKLHRHTHLYTSEMPLEAFPGRIFEVLDWVPFSKSEMKAFQGSKANVSVRNFPMTVEEIRKKWKISDGGNQYLFFATDYQEQKIVLICSKIQK